MDAKGESAMGLYTYTADVHEARVTGQIAADDLPQAIKILRSRGVHPNSIELSSAGERSGRSGTEIERVWLYRHLADLLSSGLSLARALSTLAQDIPTSSNSAILRTMAQLVATHGLTMSEAMEQYPRMFGDYGVAIVRAAEKANRLPDSLRMLAGYLDTSNRIRQKVMAPAIYPIVIIIWMGIILMFLMNFIVPKFLAMFTELGMTADSFPLPTRITMWFSESAPAISGITLLILVGLALLYWFKRRSRRVQLDLAVWSLWLPVFGGINRDCATARLLGILTLALKAGMPLHRALDAAGPASGNELMSLAMHRAADRARIGYSATEALESTKILPAGVIWHLRAAEASGNFVQACAAIADSHVANAELRTSRIAATLEPLLIILVGFCVGGVGFSVFLPLVGIISELSG